MAPITFNPAIPQVRELIINGVREIAQRYTVDGIHFDDYFYPEVDNSKESRWFDKPEYEASGSRFSIARWRRENVNELIRGVYTGAVKEASARPRSSASARRAMWSICAVTTACLRTSTPGCPTTAMWITSCRRFTGALSISCLTAARHRLRLRTT